mgnify:CR=1 FL=1
MIGGRHHDIEGAVQNGIVPVGALWGYGIRRELTEAGATRLLFHPMEIPYLADRTAPELSILNSQF